MSSLSVSNLIVSIGIAFDAQLKAADNLFFAASVDFSDPTRPMFGGSVGDASGAASTIGSPDATGFSSTNNPVSGDPVTVRQITTADGPRYQVTDNNGREIKCEAATTTGIFRNVPRYIVKADGIVYDVLAPTSASGTGPFSICNPANPNGTPALAVPLSTSFTAANITLDNYKRPIGRITFKAKEGATLARSQDDLQRTGSIVQLLTRLLESIQDEGKGFAGLIR